jgi:hypothetical protein
MVGIVGVGSALTGLRASTAGSNNSPRRMIKPVRHRAMGMMVQRGHFLIL